MGGRVAGRGCSHDSGLKARAVWSQGERRGEREGNVVTYARLIDRRVSRCYLRWKTQMTFLGNSIAALARYSSSCSPTSQGHSTRGQFPPSTVAELHPIHHSLYALARLDTIALTTEHVLYLSCLVTIRRGSLCALSCGHRAHVDLSSFRIVWV